MRLHAALIAGTLALAGCGGAAERAATTSTTQTAASDPGVRSAEHDARDAVPELPPEPQPGEPNKGTPGAQDATGGKVDVPIREGAFTPPRMRMLVGQILVFTNDDDVPHAVWNDDEPALPHSGSIPVGGRYEFTPLKPGLVRYHDPLHPEMTGTLDVRARPARCSEIVRSARHEAGDTEGDMRRDTRCTEPGR
jgi:plastocyanin